MTPEGWFWAVMIVLSIAVCAGLIYHIETTPAPHGTLGPSPAESKEAPDGNEHAR